MEKRAYALIVLVMFILPAIVSAQIDLKQGSEQLIKWAEDFASPFFSAIFGGSEYLFERILFFVIILSICYLALDQFSMFQDKPAPHWVVTVAVALLATRFLAETTLVKTIILPYTVLGVTITAAVPFVIFFFFTEKFENSVVRKMLWIFLIVLFVGIWLSQYPKIGNISFIYFVAALLSLLFFLFDGTIQRAFVNYEMKQLGLANRHEYEREIIRKINATRKDLKDEVITPAQHNQIMRRLRQQLKAIRKN